MIPVSTGDADRQDASPTSRTSFQNRPDQPHPGERQVIEGDVEEPLISDGDDLSLLSPAIDLSKAIRDFRFGI